MTGVPSWKVQPGLTRMVKVRLSVVVIDSAWASEGSAEFASYDTRPVKRASIASPPCCSVVTPGMSGFSGSPQSTVTV